MNALANVVAAIVLVALCVSGALITLRRGADQLAALTSDTRDDRDDPQGG